MIIGAGPSGLATAAQLARRGIPSVVLERGDAVAFSWRGRYDRLRLNSSRWFSTLPGAQLRARHGAFPARDDVVRYLEALRRAPRARHPLRHGAERIDRDGDGFVVRDVRRGRRRRPRRRRDGVRAAPGASRPGRGASASAATLLHAADYRNPAPFRDREVLVVGAGCSGMEIAYDVATGGAARSGSRCARRRTSSSARRSGPRSRGRWRSCRRAPPTRVARFVRRKELGDLSAYGLPVPEEGVFSRLRRLSVAPAIVDHEWIDAIKDGRVEVVAGVEALDETRRRCWPTATRVEPDAVIAATGYSCDSSRWSATSTCSTAAACRASIGGEAVAPGLRFVGYYPRPAQMGYLGAEAKVAARGIVAERGAAKRAVPLLRRVVAAAATRG